MIGLLFIGGKGPRPELMEEYRNGTGVVAAADSGLETALILGFTPDLVVGDMDSLSDESLLDRFQDRVLRFPQDKDETDTEIGLRLLQERGCTEVVIAGGGGGRLDHLLGIVILFERAHPPTRWITDRDDVRLIQGEAVLEGVRGETVSLFPLGDGAGMLGSEGLKWELDGLELTRGYAGISNVVTRDRARVRVGKGRLLMVRTLSGEVA